MQPAPSGIRSDDFGESMTTDMYGIYSCGYLTDHRRDHRQLPTKVADQLGPDQLGPSGSIFRCRAKDCGMFRTTNHNKAAVCSLVSQPIMAYAGLLLGNCRWLYLRRPVHPCV